MSFEKRFKRRYEMANSVFSMTAILRCGAAFDNLGMYENFCTFPTKKEANKPNTPPSCSNWPGFGYLYNPRCLSSSSNGRLQVFPLPRNPFTFRCVFLHFIQTIPLQACPILKENRCWLLVCEHQSPVSKLDLCGSMTTTCSFSLSIRDM